MLCIRVKISQIIDAVEVIVEVMPAWRLTQVVERLCAGVCRDACVVWRERRGETVELPSNLVWCRVWN